MKRAVFLVSLAAFLLFAGSLQAEMYTIVDGVGNGLLTVQDGPDVHFYGPTEGKDSRDALEGPSRRQVDDPENGIHHTDPKPDQIPAENRMVPPSVKSPWERNRGPHKVPFNRPTPGKDFCPERPSENGNHHVDPSGRPPWERNRNPQMVPKPGRIPAEHRMVPPSVRPPWESNRNPQMVPKPGRIPAHPQYKDGPDFGHGPFGQSTTRIYIPGKGSFYLVPISPGHGFIPKDRIIRHNGKTFKLVPITEGGNRPLTPTARPIHNGTHNLLGHGPTLKGEFRPGRSIHKDGQDFMGHGHIPKNGKPIVIPPKGDDTTK